MCVVHLEEEAILDVIVQTSDGEVWIIDNLANLFRVTVLLDEVFSGDVMYKVLDAFLVGSKCVVVVKPINIYFV